MYARYACHFTTLNTCNITSTSITADVGLKRRARNSLASPASTSLITADAGLKRRARHSLASPASTSLITADAGLKRRARHSLASPASTSLSVYIPIDEYKQTNSALLQLLTYLPHNMFYLNT